MVVKMRYLICVEKWLNADRYNQIYFYFFQNVPEELYITIGKSP